MQRLAAVNGLVALAGSESYIIQVTTQCGGPPPHILFNKEMGGPLAYWSRRIPLRHCHLGMKRNRNYVPGGVSGSIPKCVCVCVCYGVVSFALVAM